MDGDGDGDFGALVLNVCTNVTAVTSSTTSVTTYSCNSSAWVPVYGVTSRYKLGALSRAI